MSAKVSGVAVFAVALFLQFGAKAETVIIAKADCAKLVTHQARPDVAFKPGVGPHGKPVAPADLPGTGTNGWVPDKIQFEVKVNPMLYGGAAASTGAAAKYANSAVNVAHIEVDPRSGQVLLNGKPLASEQQQALQEVCR
ncbi:MAG TPA: hypothetical protein HPP80_01335 [Rhodospirillaceae bacterium]|nr:hypothetical protein [Rhodospirillaceae bacterium]